MFSPTSIALTIPGDSAWGLYGCIVRALLYRLYVIMPVCIGSKAYVHNFPICPFLYSLIFFLFFFCAGVQCYFWLKNVIKKSKGNPYGTNVFLAV